MKVLAINGSHRKNGNTKVLLEEVLKEGKKAKADCKLLDLADYDIKYCQAHERSFCREKGCVYEDGVGEILKEMEKADAIIIGSPVYMGTITGKLKAFMDRSSILRRKDFRLSGKVGAAVAVGGAQGGGQEYTIAAIHQFFLIHNMTVVCDGKPNAHFGVVAVASGAGDVKEKDKGAIEVAKSLAERVMEELKLRS